MSDAAPFPALSQHQAELLAGMEKKLKVVWEEASDAMAFVDDEGLLDCNDAARDLFGFTSSDVYLGAPLHHFAPPTQCDGSSSREFLAREWGRAFESGRSRCECLLQRPDGSQFVADLVMTSIGMGAGNILHLVFRDITRRWQREQALHEAQRAAADSLFQAANFDPLTGLPNRRHLSQQAHQAIGTAEQSQQGVALLCLDIRNFHSINNALGHDIGDQLLQTVAERLQRLARTGDVVARLGGNEFAILLQGERASLAMTVTHQAITELTRTILLNGRLVSIAPAIGISRWPEDAYHAESLIEHAGTALYAAKSGNLAYRQYAPAMRADALARVEMESHLRNGLELGEFFLHYQPQIEFASGRIIGTEALVRWQHPPPRPDFPEPVHSPGRAERADHRPRRVDHPGSLPPDPAIDRRRSAGPPGGGEPLRRPVQCPLPGARHRTGPGRFRPAPRLPRTGTDRKQPDGILGKHRGHPVGPARHGPSPGH